jgi:NMD protein affecting ribosome stability and mRNA decay
MPALPPQITREAYFSKEVPQKVKLNPELKSAKFFTNVVLDMHGKTHSVDVKINGKYEGIAVSERYDFPIEKKAIICEDCRKSRPEYYEAVLQVRDATPELIGKIQKLLETQKIHRSINKHEAYESGGDYFFSNKRIAQQVGKTLRSKFGGTLEASKRLFTRDRQTSKDVYRTTVLYRAPKNEEVRIIK